MQARKIQQQQEANKQNEELSSLLQTNKILIENKKSIYQTKIATFDRQIKKINNMLIASGNNDDSDEEGQLDKSSGLDHEERKSLIAKLDSIKLKRQEAIEKLDAIFQIEQDIKHVNTQESVPVNNNNKNEGKCLKMKAKTVLSQTMTENANYPECLQGNSNQKDMKQWVRNIPQQGSPSYPFPFNPHPNQKSRTMSVQVVQCAQNTYRIQRSKPNCSVIQQKGSPSLPLQKNNKKRVSEPDVRLHSAEQKKCYPQDSDKQDTVHNNYYLIDGNRGNKEEIQLWSDCNHEHQQDQEHEQEQEDGMDNSRVEMKQFTEGSADKYSFPIAKSKQLDRETNRPMRKKEGKHTHMTPISITKKQEKSVREFEEVRQRQINLTEITNQQYVLIAEQINNTMQCYENFHNDYIKIADFTKHANSTRFFKSIFQALVKIKHQCQKDQLTIQSLSTKMKDLQKIEVEEQRRNQQYLRDKAKQQEKERELKLHVLKLQHEKQSMEKELIKIEKHWEEITDHISRSEADAASAKRESQKAKQAKQQIEKNMEEVLAMYLQKFKSIEKDLLEAQESISLTEREQTNQRLSYNPKKKQSNIAICNLQECSQNITQMYEFIRSSVQSQKVTALQNKQMLVSLQYQVGLLKGQQKRLQSRNKQLLDKLQNQTLSIKQLQKQVGKMTKQKQAHQQTLKQIQSQIQQYDNLQIIRKQAYKQLESKYTSLKTKKNKMEKSIQKLETEVKEIQIKQHKMEEYYNKRQASLEEISQQIREKIGVKEEVERALTELEDIVHEKEKKLNKLQASLQAKEEQYRHIQKQTHQVQQKLQILTESEQKLSNKVEKLLSQLKQLQENKKQAKLTLEQLVQELTQTQKQLQDSKKHLNNVESETQAAQQQRVEAVQKTESAEARLKEVSEETVKMESMQEELQSAIQQLLEKKQEAVAYLSLKCDELENMEQTLHTLRDCTEETEAHCQEKQNQIQQLKEQTQELEKQRQSLETTIEKMTKELEELDLLLEGDRLEEDSLRERLTQLRRVEASLLLEIAMIAFPSPPRELPTTSLRSILPQQTKESIEGMLRSLADVKQMKQQFEKEKQQNRKLKLENEHYRKLIQIQENEVGASSSY